MYVTVHLAGVHRCHCCCCCVQGTPRMTAVTHVIIELLDVNDNPPEFVQLTYEQVLGEDAPLGSTVTQVYATSRDIGVNAQISYHIVAGNDGGHFEIDSESGAFREIVLAQQFVIAFKFNQQSA